MDTGTWDFYPCARFRFLGQSWAKVQTSLPPAIRLVAGRVCACRRLHGGEREQARQARKEVASPLDRPQRQAAERGLRQSRRRHVQAERAQHHVGEVQRNLRLPDPPKKTFDEVADYWLTVRAAGKRSLSCDKSIIRAHLRPAFGGVLITRIGTRRSTAEGLEGSPSSEHAPPHPHPPHLAAAHGPGPELAPGHAEGEEAQDSSSSRRTSTTWVRRRTWPGSFAPPRRKANWSSSSTHDGPNGDGNIHIEGIGVVPSIDFRDRGVVVGG